MQSTASDKPEPMDRSRRSALVATWAFAALAAGFSAGVAVSGEENEEVAPVEQLAEATIDAELEEVQPEEVSHEVLPDEVALEQARALGLLDVIRETRPTLRDGLVERMGIAFVREAHRNGIDPLLLTAVGKVESHFNPFATSSVGARGLLQVKPSTGRWMLSHDKEDLIDDGELYDLETNVELGARYLASLLTRFDSVEVALVAYNRGPRGARLALSGPNRREVLRGYPRKVLKARDALERRGVVATLEKHEDAARL